MAHAINRLAAPKRKRDTIPALPDDLLVKAQQISDSVSQLYVLHDDQDAKSMPDFFAPMRHAAIRIRELQDAMDDYLHQLQQYCEAHNCHNHVMYGTWVDPAEVRTYLYWRCTHCGKEGQTWGYPPDYVTIPDKFAHFRRPT